MLTRLSWVMVPTGYKAEGTEDVYRVLRERRDGTLVWVLYINGSERQVGRRMEGLFTRAQTLENQREARYDAPWVLELEAVS